MSHKLKEELLELLEAKEAAVKYNKISTLFPDKGEYRRELYPKHIEFLEAGSEFAERAFIAANRTGKTLTGAYEVTCHLTGEYPTWWKGRKFLNPTNGWAANKTAQLTKEVQQLELLGSLDDIGTGLIPKDKILKVTRKSGVADSIETVYVKHISGGTSTVTFKSYDQKRESFQGTKKQWIWLDEEPTDKNIYSECLTRTMDRYNPGIIICTFTPLFGLSDLVLSFLPHGKMPECGVDPENPHKFVTQVSWEEVPHLNEAQKAKILASYDPYEREARSRGIPSLGSGAIYPYLEDDISVQPVQIQVWWPKAYGMDVGWNRTAVVWGALDPDSNILYIYSEHYASKEQPAVHASSIKARGEHLWGAIDPASKGLSQVDGRALFDLYDQEGLHLELADNAREAGILKVGQGFASGQIKIFNTCTNLLSEYRVYRRDADGKIIKKNDHALDALRYLVMGSPGILSLAPDPDMFQSKKQSGDKHYLTGY